MDRARRTPKDHNATQPERRRDPFQQYVGWYLEDDVLTLTSQHCHSYNNSVRNETTTHRDEEHEQRYVVIVPTHLQLSSHTLNLRIANIRTIQKCEKEQDSQPRRTIRTCLVCNAASKFTAARS
jgi:hypothetical protein